MADSFIEVTAYASYALVGDLLKTMAFQNGPALLQAIAKAGLDVNVADGFGRTLLMHAVHLAACYKIQKPREKIVAGIRCLVENRAKISLADDRGETALGLALKFRQKDIAKLLLQHGVEFTSRIN